MSNQNTAWPTYVPSAYKINTGYFPGNYYLGNTMYKTVQYRDTMYTCYDNKNEEQNAIL